jgi:hypothetical protein
MSEHSSSEKTQLWKWLRNVGGARTRRQMSSAIGMPKSHVKSALEELAEEGLVRRVGRTAPLTFTALAGPSQAKGRRFIAGRADGESRHREPAREPQKPPNRTPPRPVSAVPTPPKPQPEATTQQGVAMDVKANHSWRLPPEWQEVHEEGDAERPLDLVPVRLRRAYRQK